MRRCPRCGSKVPPSRGAKPKTFCSERCRVRQSEERRSVRRELAERRYQRDLVAAGRLVVSDGWGRPVPVDWIERRIATLEAELERLTVRGAGGG